MPAATETSDAGILDLLRRSGSLGISELARATRVTPTAVRQRLSRLLAQGLIERETLRASRGRPSHLYSLTEKGHRQGGDNFADLAVLLWGEIRAVTDAAVRKGLLQRLAKGMAGMYRERIHGDSTGERMQSVADLFVDRNVPVMVEQAPGQLPVLTALACPYPELAEQDRGICAMERMLFSELVGQNMRLSQCRLDGDNCCQFTTHAVAHEVTGHELAGVEHAGVEHAGVELAMHEHAGNGATTTKGLCSAD